VVVAASNRMVQAGRRLERHLEPPAGLDEFREPNDAWDNSAAAAHLRAETELAEPEDAEGDVVAQRQLVVNLGRGIEEDLGVEARCLDRFDPVVLERKLPGVDDDGQPERLVAELRELRGRADEPVDDPARLALTDAVVLGDPLGERKLRGREGRRVVDQAREERGAGICRRLAQLEVM